MVFSFLTAKLSIELEGNRAEYKAGETVKGRVKLNTFGKVDARKFHVCLCCSEWMKHIDPRKEDGGKEIALWKKDFRLGDKGVYKAGEWAFEFQVPKESVPTITPDRRNKYSTKGAGVKWALHAQMDLPSSLDLHAYKQVFVY